MLVLGRVHVVSQLVGRQKEFLLKTQHRPVAVFLRPTVLTAFDQGHLPQKKNPSQTSAGIAYP